MTILSLLLQSSGVVLARRLSLAKLAVSQQLQAAAYHGLQLQVSQVCLHTNWPVESMEGGYRCRICFLRMHWESPCVHARRTSRVLRAGSIPVCICANTCVARSVVGVSCAASKGYLVVARRLKKRCGCCGHDMTLHICKPLRGAYVQYGCWICQHRLYHCSQGGVAGSPSSSRPGSPKVKGRSVEHIWWQAMHSPQLSVCS
ncbi:hypothetical protein COO60DRAFT_1518568 [Scenedesmus sp. NREL 46B-D3]|nr:hypothetical protein COO60DRAFT_1518568 [Scenedesmus sp. NREL 46B-D3]